jgi:hypothetical protein
MPASLGMRQGTRALHIERQLVNVAGEKCLEQKLCRMLKRRVLFPVHLLLDVLPLETKKVVHIFVQYRLVTWTPLGRLTGR